MTAFLLRYPGRTVGPLITGAAFYVAAAGALRLTHAVDGLAALWPANGILLAALIIAAPRHAWRHVAAAALASLAANIGAGIGPVPSAGYTAANIAEALIAWRLARGRDRDLSSFLTPTAVARFFFAAFAAALCSATLATLFHLSAALDTWSSWVTTDLLGMLIVTPVVVTGYAAAEAGDRRAVRPGEAAALLAGVGAAAALAFGQSGFPLIFLSLAALLAATLRLGPFGAAASVAVIAGVGTYCTSVGLGPLPAIAHGNAKLPIMFFQFYLFVLLVTSLPLGALLAARDRLVRRLAESNRLLRLAEQSAGVGHWRIGVTGQDSYCSPEVLRIHGITGDDKLPLTRALADYCAEDRGRVVALVRHALRDGTPFEFEARIVTAAGEERRVHSRGFPDRTEDGVLLGLFGTMQDVTRQVEGKHALEAARTAAEQAARVAIAAAETDALTGVANRRKIVAMLDDAIAAACVTAKPLSVAMIDLDHFKAINDRHGHLVGDEVLVRVARIAAGSLRGADTVGRMGGEEFVILLPSADGDQAAAVGERVRAAIASVPADQPALAVTASVGVATLAPGESPAALLHRADLALYAAKGSGRNTLRRAA